MNEMDLIIGVHSIAEALRNPQRKVYQLVGAEDGFKELYKRGGIDPKEIAGIEQKKLATHQVQEEAKKEYAKRELTYQRVPSQIFALTSPMEFATVQTLMEAVQGDKKLKILALDQVTDTHNAAAIMRTAAFYGVDYLIISQKGNFGLTPSFYRIASGATEHVGIVKAASLAKLLNKMQQLGIECIGLSEHASDENLSSETPSLCLVLGAEDVGMSNAVQRVVSKTIALRPTGNIKSLNVSVAAAVAMEKLFS